METVYFYCAAIGGGFLVLLVLMMLVGGDHTDVDAHLSTDMHVSDTDASSVLFQLSLKTVIAFVTFFGLAGMACTQAEMTSGKTLVAALAAGLVAFLMVGYLMQAMLSLQSRGNLDLTNAVGAKAKVDLRIPGKHAGAGKVTVIVGGRIKTQKAVTKGEAIPTGAEVLIVGMTSPDTFEVSTPE